MQDGQNLFDPATAAFRDWKIPRTMEKLPLRQQAIIVGIDNTAGRMHEYAPYRRGRNGGRGDDYLRFVVDTVKPFLDRDYRTLPQRESTGIAGSSMGGLIALYAGLQYSQVFGRAGVLSPSLWFNPKLLDSARQHSSIKSNLYVAGSKTEQRSMESTLQNLYWALKTSGHHDDQIRVIIRDRGRHNEAFWAREFKKMMEWLWN
jgi:alpha-glucosidase